MELKHRFQRQEKCAATATKGKTKDKTSRPAQHSYLSGKNYLLTVDQRMMSELTWHRSRKLRRHVSTTGQ
jgi:hypothetical protein